LLKTPGCFAYDKNNHTNKPMCEKLLPGSLVYNIVNPTHNTVTERKPFYIQNHKSYLENLEKNCKKMGIPFKKPNVEEIQPHPKIDTNIESYIETLDTVVLNLTVLKNGKVKVKLMPQMAMLNEKYYSKGIPPPLKSVLSVLKSHGYSNEFIQSVKDKHKKRLKLIEIKWKKLQYLYESAAPKKKKKIKKKETPEIIEEEAVIGDDDEDDDEEKDDEPEEDEGLDVEIDEEDGGNVEEEEYISGGDD
jgi:hypothetical protein